MSEQLPTIFAETPDEQRQFGWFGRAETRRRRARRSKEAPGARTFMNMGHYAIDLAASAEPDPILRLRKRLDLLALWRRYSRTALRLARTRRE